jgi:hypothetical protein
LVGRFSEDAFRRLVLVLLSATATAAIVTSALRIAS